MPAYRQDDWNQLIGAYVEIRRDFETVRFGFVDDAMPDSSALWLCADGKNGRQIFSAAEGYDVWAQPMELTGKLAFRMTASALQLG